MAKFLDPLEPILGPDSILVRKMGATEIIWGRPLNLIELMQKLCGDCKYENVIEAIDAFTDVYRTLSLLTDASAIVGGSDDGCNVRLLIDAFSADFSADDPTPVLSGSAVNVTDLVWEEEPILDSKRPTVETLWGASMQGEFAFRFLLFDRTRIPSMIIGLILGQDISIAEVTIPKMQIEAAAQISIPVWPSPLIRIKLGMGGSATLDVGAVTLGTKGIVDVIEGGSGGNLLNSISMPADRWPIRASVFIMGGVSVDLWLLEGGAEVRLVFEGRMRFADYDGEGKIFFGNLFWRIKANNGNIFDVMDINLKVSLKIYLYLKLCINLVFVKKCVKLASWDKT